jgi:hypothetical protein
MDNRNDSWTEFGEDVKRTIQQAVASGDYTNLNSEIRNLTERATSMGTQAARQAVESIKSKSTQNGYGHKTYYSSTRDKRNTSYQSSQWNSATQSPTEDGYQHVYGQEYSKAQWDPKRNRPKAKLQPNPPWRPPALYKRTGARKALTLAGAVSGFTAGGICMAVFGLLSIWNPGFLIGVGCSALALVGGAFGSGGYAKTERFDQYVHALQNKTYGSVEALAAAVKKPVKWVRKDLQKFIDKGWFKEGHLDEGGTTLMTSNRTYQQYIETKENSARAKAEAEEKARREQEERNRKYAGLSESQLQIIKQGEDYIREIHEYNEKIPGEVISDKLDRLEDSVRRIIDRARRHPRYVDDLRRLMNYYLPTTVKLLSAYVDLDREEKETENIVKSKREIEQTIDTLNDAFENLFDNMFEDTNLDIVTDAEVMRTLLEQEGLTGTGWKERDEWVAAADARDAAAAGKPE